ncbi:MAG: tetratricopeptide repeat protein [Sphingobacteriaceae bacterium]|nr:tetratricopeptide repeat protein [Sphingobacteriaceae bacterium]
MHSLIKVAITSFWILTGLFATAQPTQIFNQPEESLRTAIRLYEQERYVAAKKQFEKIIDQVFPPSDMEEEKRLYREARFYRALSSAQLRQKDADFQLLSFIEDFPEALEVNEAKFYLGQFYFISKKYKEVIPVLASLDASLLPIQQAAAAHYYLGYSYFTRDMFKDAKRAFLQISGLKNEYHYPANYYLGVITYEEGNGPAALAYFNLLKESANYSRIIPYYICKLQFELGMYDELLAYALPLSANKEVKQLANINYLIAQAYFKKSEFVKAIPYLKRYQEQGGQLVSEDYYQLGYAAYVGKDYKTAVTNLSKAASRNDSVGQSATFILGDCYLRLDKKEQALTSFYAASRLSFDLEVQETAAFNHAKLGYELNIHPQSLTWLKDFVTNYPRSKYGDEAREHLGNLLLSTKNFKEAVDVIEGINNRNLTINRSYQKVAYYRGVELFNQGVFQEAIRYFDKSLTQSLDKNISAMAYFWKGESLYRLGSLRSAVTEFQKFIQAFPVTNGLEPENSLIAAHYALGYCYFKQQDYLLAISHFENASKEIQASDSKIQQHQFVQSIFGDLLLRLGDAHFAINAYPQAINYYQMVMSRNLAGADYANYQEAILQGLANSKDKKVASLKTLIRKYPGSLYLDNAMLELANTYFINDQFEEALKQLDSLIMKRPNSFLVKNALLVKGLILYNNEQYEPAIAAYKQVISNYPKTQEARDALAGIKNIYIQLNKVETYLQYAATVPSARVTLTEQDSITFQAVELVYNQSDCDKAIPELTRYLNKFPDGFFAVNARFLRADCYARTNKQDLMVQDLTFVADQPRNMYSERTFARLSKYYFERKDYNNAIVFYSKLEQNSDSRWNVLDAYQGLMRSNFALSQWSEARAYANKVVAYEHSNETAIWEAKLILARLLLINDELSNALLAFTGLYEQTKSEYGAAAKFFIAEIQFKRKEFVPSQNTIFELVDKIPYYDEWIGKAFLLLAETYVALDEDFQAIATLQSIIENRPVDAISNQARMRLTEIKARQVQKRSSTQQLNNNIPSNGDGDNGMGKDGERKQGTNNNDSMKGEPNND